MDIDKQHLQDQLQALRAQYLKDLPGKLQQLRRSAIRFGDDGISPAQWRDLGRQAHALAGSGSTFGCPDVSELARQICTVSQHVEELSNPADEASREQLEQLLGEMEGAAQRYIERTRKQPLHELDDSQEDELSAPHAPLVYIVDDDVIYAENLAAQLRAAGYSIHVIENLVALRHETELRKPAAILMDMVLAEGQLAGAEATSHYAHTLGIPVVFLSVRSDIEARLAAVRAGASQYFIKPVASARIAAMLDHLTSRPGTDRYNILLVDDDVNLSALYARYLESAGMQVTVLNDPMQAMDMLSFAQMDLIVLDVDMPQMTGLELAALIRQMDEYNHIPIVFLSADSAIQTRMAGMHLGADDYLTKPVQPEFLVKSLKARAARARTLRDGRQGLQRAMHDLEFMHDALNEHAIVAVTDAEGRIVYSNQKFSEISGYSALEARGKTHRLVKSGEHPESVYEDLWQTISAGRVWQGTLINRAKNGQLYDVNTTIVPKLDEAGLPVQYLAIRTDVTALRALERQKELMQQKLVQAAKMESIGHLTAGIAHDFNNLLGGILGYAELGAEFLARENGPDKIKNYLTHILAAGTRAKELITQMLIFSRLTPEAESGEVPVTLLQPVVKEVTHLLRSTIPSGIVINYQVENVDLRARIQPVHLHQILMNLAVNARDAIGEYGRIEINLTQRAVTGQCDACHEPFSGDYAVLTLSDSGPGIPDHVLASIFDPFFTTKEVGKGTGMGLSVVHGIVHALGGHITVESEAGKGTAIHILLPLAAHAHDVIAEVMPVPNSSAGVLTSLRIMVVDDEFFMASMLEELLSMHGAQVVTFSKPQEALTAFEREPNSVDLVITDATMPDLSGMDMAQAMLRVRAGMPIILCTGYSETVDANIASQSGLMGFMYKPLEIPKLLSLIQERLLHARPAP